MRLQRHGMVQTEVSLDVFYKDFHEDSDILKVLAKSFFFWGFPHYCINSKIYGNEGLKKWINKAWGLIQGKKEREKEAQPA